ncbi:MAG: hypothetical protein ABIM50_05435 [Novosphingobium sp.]
MTLTTTAAIAAEELPGAGASYTAANDIPMPAAPDVRPEWRPQWRGAATSSVLLPDSRTRDAWLRECRHRTSYYYDDGGHYRHDRRHDQRHDGGYAPSYDYCEAYFDDYYRTYTRPAVAYAYQMPSYQSATTYQSGPWQVEEVVTERYEPLRSRIIQHRRARPDKRIRIAP